MQHNVTCSLGVCLSEKGFSLDELVLRLNDLFENKAYSEILRHILLLTEELLRLPIMLNSESRIKCACGCGILVLNGHQSRQISTRLGKIKFDRLTRVKCSDCGKTFTLLLRFLCIDAYQSKTDELEKLVLEQVAGDSYRRANKNVRSMTGVQASHTTFHNWVLKTKADEIVIPPNVIGSAPGEVFTDGTKCKALNTDGKSIRGDIKVMIGVNASGETYPIGTWTHNESWDVISQELNQRKIVFPDGTVLVSDGEVGLAESLSQHFSDQQRCHWHLVRDTYHFMWQNGGTLKESKPVQDTLKAILAIELPKEEFKKVSEAEKDSIEEHMEKAENHIDALIEHLKEKGYIKAANYIQNSKQYLFSYVRRWLKLGISCPRASSLIERTMREITRRVKRISYNWKEEGLGKVVKIILKIFTNYDQWLQYWNERMEINQSVMLSFRIVKT